MHRMDWDNLRFFLAVARKGSIRSASAALAVNHTTVSRRISVFEKKIGVRLFDRLPTGYVLTPTGEEMLASAERVEEEVIRLDRQVIGRDAQLSGVLRVTMPGPLASHLLMPDFAAFGRAYPGIRLELIISCEAVNLKKREADVAIRITESPPDYLVGRHAGSYKKAIYASHEYCDEHDVERGVENLTWIGWEDSELYPQWVKDSLFPTVPVHHQAGDPYAQLEAAKAGMGLIMLPCFMGDPVPELRRIALVNHSSCCAGDIWILTHQDLRATARVHVFIDFMTQAFARHREALAGDQPTVQEVISAARAKPARKPVTV